jgi:hypothetical protein
MAPAAAPDENHDDVRLGLALFRKGVDSIRASRPSCSVCSRRPLVGETAWLFDRAGTHRWVCASCLSSRAARKLGKPVGRHLVRPNAGTVTLRRAA